MAKDTTVRKFKKNDFTSDFEYGRSEKYSGVKKVSGKKQRSPNPRKNFDHLLYEDWKAKGDISSISPSFLHDLYVN